MSSNHEKVLRTMFEPILTYKVEGKLVSDSLTLDINFQCRQLGNGRIVGEIVVHDVANEFVIFKMFQNHKRFVIEGSDLQSGNNIVIHECFLVSAQSSYGRKESELKALFDAFELIQNPERLEDIPINPLVITFGVLNVDETFRVIVNTSLGELYLAHVPDHKKRVEAITLENVKESARGLLREGDMVFLQTNHSKLWGTEEYWFDSPYLSIEAARWLIENRVKLVGIDGPRRDCYRAQDRERYIIHEILTEAGFR